MLNGIARSWIFVSLLVCSVLPGRDSVATTSATEPKGDHQQNIYWVNDREVLFVGYERDQLEALSASRESQGQLERSVLIWNFESRTLRVLAKASTGILCFYNNSIYYERVDNGAKRRFYGPMGSENPINYSGGLVDVSRCRFSDDQFNNHIQEPRTLNWHRGAVNQTRAIDEWARFYPFKGAYLLLERGLDGKEVELWWAYPAGHSEKINLPGVHWDGYSYLRATRTGILEHRPARRDWALYWVPYVNEEGPRFNFLSAKAKKIRIVDGVVRRYAVSPSGCKVAYLWHPLFPASENPLERLSTLRQIDVCLSSSTHK